MKKLIYTLCLLLSFNLYASSNDTIKIIVKGDLILIEMDNHQELEQLVNHDLNAMFKNLLANTNSALSDSIRTDIRVEMFIQEDSVLHQSNKAIDKINSDLKAIKDIASTYDAQITIYDQEIEDDEGKQIKKTLKISKEGIQIIDSDITEKDEKKIELALNIGHDADDTENELARTNGMTGIYFGINNYIGVDNQIVSNVNHSLKRGFSFGLVYLAKTKIFKNGPLYLKYGISGVSNNYYFTRNVQLVELENNSSVQEFEYDVKKSKLVTGSFEIPLLLQLDFSANPRHEDGFNIAIGAFAGFVGNVRSKIVYKDNEGNWNKDKTDGDFYVRKHRYGLQSQIGVLGVNLWSKYHLTSLFEDNKGPEELNVFEFGIKFDF